MSLAVYELLQSILGIYMFIVFAWVVASWLTQFGIINTRNPLVYNIVKSLSALVIPVIRPIQRILPSFGGLDFSPIVLILGINFVRTLLASFYNTGTIL